MLLWAALFAFSLVLLGRIAYWQLIRRDELRSLGELEHYQPQSLQPRRGQILDRHGAVLATDLFTYEVAASPSQVADPEALAQEMALWLGQSEGKLWEQLLADQPSVTLARQVPPDTASAIASLGHPEITLWPAPTRTYPEGDLAAHLLGFVGGDNRGLYGLEAHYDRVLVGQAGSRGSSEDPSGVAAAVRFGAYIPATDGPSLILTLDRTLQKLVEEELQAGLDASGAEAGTIVALEPATGKVLAMASRPAYDGNRYYLAEPQERYVDPAVSQVYEPGSVYKLVTMAAALDSGLVTPNDTYEDSGSIRVGGQLIYNWDYSARGTVTMTELIQHSLNVGAATLSTNMGWETFYHYVRRFGFAEVAGIDLDGEVPGLVKVPGDPDWYEADLGTNAFGQGIAVTPLQMAASAAAVANQGILMRPYIVDRIIWPDGTTSQIEPLVRRRVLEADSARALSAMLVASGGGETSLARIPGYAAAGKTGTAQIPIPGGYDPQGTIASFVGYLPADEPQILILVVLVRPTASPWGSVVAAPVFRAIAERAVAYLGIPPDDVRLRLRAEAAGFDGG
ncbi:MAG: peptidoglycan D,D-transpeptidase FtsI family protein [Anaerolineae bacterium]